MRRMKAMQVLPLCLLLHSVRTGQPAKPACNTAFIPGRPGGFDNEGSVMGCCVLQQALDLAWVFQSLLYCPDVRPPATTTVAAAAAAGTHANHRRVPLRPGCSSWQAQRVRAQLRRCCSVPKLWSKSCTEHE